VTCYNPIECVYPYKPDSEGKMRLKFSKKYIYDCFNYDNVLFRLGQEEPVGFKIKVPCGHCIGCMIDRSRMWSLRSVDEADAHKHNEFLTLTFNDKYINDSKSVSKVFLSQFLKRFRYYYGDGIRFLAVGEYGEKKLRPHYHLLLYNFQFDDKYVYKYDYKRNIAYYRSPFLENKVWCDVSSKESLGFAIIGDVNFQTSAYVARYCTKKLFNSKKARLAYFADKEPEFLNYSRNYGLGLETFIEYHKDIMARGYCTLRNGDKFIKMPVPRFYEDKAKLLFPNEYAEFKYKSLQFLIKSLFEENLDNSTQRLKTREELKKLKVDKLIRSYELDIDLHNI